LHRSQRAFEPPSAPGAVPGSSPAQENVPSFNSTFDRASRFGHDFCRIPIHPLAAGALQTKLAINKPGDEYEQEADRITQQVMRMPEPQLQRACACGGACTKCQTEQPGQVQEHLQTKRVGSGDQGQTAVPPIVHEVLRSPGQRLDPATRAFMEPRFGHDFANVRVHTNNRAAESAEAVNALAYTAGDNIVFSAGQYAPASSLGQWLLAHELTHVVQQNGVQTLHGEFVGRPDISRAPASSVSRKASAQDEDQKKDAVKWHVTQQLHVAGLLDKARKIKPDPAKGPLDGDNLYHNSVEMVDNGTILLSIMTPIHDWQTRKPGQLAYFDWHVKYRRIGGDYPADPAIQDIQTGLAFADPLTTGETTMLSATMPGFVSLYTKNDPISEDELKQVFVHEAQHVADLSGPKQQDTTLDLWQRVFEAYKTEFRAHWIQPVPPPVCSQGLCLAQPSVFHLGSFNEHAKNDKKVTISHPGDCKFCPAPSSSDKPSKSTPAETKTRLKNKRQEDIFWQLIFHYPAKQFDCCYVYNQHFHTAVDAFDYPGSVNLINSTRLMDLNLKLQNLKPSMSRSEVGKTDFFVALLNLDVLDWAFLNDPKLSKPFWDALKIVAPGFLYKGVNALVKKGTKNPVSAADVNKALSGK